MPTNDTFFMNRMHSLHLKWQRVRGILKKVSPRFPLPQLLAVFTLKLILGMGWDFREHIFPSTAKGRKEKIDLLP
jgi:hypothetical protein